MNAGAETDSNHARDNRQPSAALNPGLKQRGLLDDTLGDLGRRVRADI